MCSYYIASLAVRYHVCSLAYSTLFCWWCHTGTNTKCWNQATGGGYSDLTDGSVLPVIIGLQCGKNEPVYYSFVNANLISSLKTRLAYASEEPHYLTATVLNPRNKLRLTDDSVKKDNADHRADERSWHFPARWLCYYVNFSQQVQHLTTFMLAVVHSDISEDKTAAGELE